MNRNTPERRRDVQALKAAGSREGLDLAIDNAPDADGSGGGHIAVAMSAVRAIPDVMASPSGVVVPRVFGAYRWEPQP